MACFRFSEELMEIVRNCSAELTKRRKVRVTQRQFIEEACRSKAEQEGLWEQTVKVATKKKKGRI